eukprot:CAMPEP_0203683408 /NCGR_PEP_ID=MMETSP0090-20130426/47509_1 /ASSEMBLY_ACC=CAM_ASM_001088 /TAXON_ID=426623 /ORGANISM="Chaetoceros affinis, Strain CCMP159" /LENGTH=537 /DNA_ID=CAMNT_0050552551 /DNA_START=311 /DNA_END=1925 /DNA_ORIENTATION=-
MSNSSDGDNVNDNQHQQTEEQTMDTTSSSEDTVLKNSSLNSRDSIVRFNELRIREYNLIPCQNPFCSSGCPVSMGWRIQRETSISLDEYEQHRPPRRGNLQMPADVRQDLLMREWDVPFSAIRQTIQETSAERELRMKSQRKLSRKKSKMKKMQLLGKVFSCVPKLVSVSGSFKKSKFMSRKEAKDLELGSTRMVSGVPSDVGLRDEISSQSALDDSEHAVVDDNSLTLDVSCRRPLNILFDENHNNNTFDDQKQAQQSPKKNLQRETSISLDEYEQHRPPRRGNLQMPADVRQDLLMREWDVPFSAIRQTIQETSAERELRMKSQRKLSRKKSKMKKMQLLGKVFSCVPKLVSVSGSFKKSKFMSRKEAKDLELGSTRMKQAQQSPKKNSPKRNANSTNIQADAMSSLMKASCYRRYSNEFRLPTDQTLPTEAEAIESQLEQPEDDTGLGLAKSESADSVDSHTCSFETKQDNDDDEEEDDSTLETDEDGSPLEIEKDSDLSMTSLRDLSDDLSVELEGLDVTQRRTNSIGIMLAA